MKNQILFSSAIVTVLLLGNMTTSPAQANTTIGENGITNDSGRLAPSFTPTPGETAASPAALTGVSGGSELFSGGGGGGGGASSSAASADGGSGGGGSSSAASAGAASAGAAATTAAATTGATMAGLSSGSSGSVSLGG